MKVFQMFFHTFFNEIRVSLRVRDLLFWLILFPIILGFCFKVAFGNLYQKEHTVTAIPVAVVESEGEEGKSRREMFLSVLESVSREAETEGTEKDSLLSVTRCSEEEAMEALKRGEVKGIIFVGEELSLTVSKDGLEQSILKLFLEQYLTRESIIRETVKTDPSKLPSVISALSEDIQSTEQGSLTEGNVDSYVQFFLNLIGMVAMYGSVTGLHIAVSQQANLSPLGARKNCSATPKSVLIFASLAGTCVVQSVCMIITVTFISLVLRVDLGQRLPLIYLSAVLGGMLGVSFGFFVGSIGKMKEGMKVAICMTISMTMSFLSGLMFAPMKPLMMKYAPWLNNLNPAALVTDSITALNLYSTYDVFRSKILTMILMSAVFYILGLILVRRRKYASI